MTAKKKPAEPAQQLVVEDRPRSLLIDMAHRYGMEPGPFEATLRATVCRGNLSREDFAAFLLVAREHRLNPVLREIYALPVKGGGIAPYVPIDGWVRIINDHPAMNGMDFEDHIEDDTGKLLSVTCTIRRKDRGFPTTITEYMSECFRPTDQWRERPARMLRHKALIQCARYAFGFSNLYDFEEAQRIAQGRTYSAEPASVQLTSAFTAKAISEPPAAEGEPVDELPDFDPNVDDPSPAEDAQFELFDLRAWVAEMNANLDDYVGVKELNEDFAEHAEALKHEHPGLFRALSGAVAKRTLEIERNQHDE